MAKKLKWFYRISICLISIFILSNIIVKSIVWPAAYNTIEGDHRYRIYLRRHIPEPRFTTRIRQKLFLQVDYLLPPAFGMLFTLIALKLITTPGILEVKEQTAQKRT